MDTTIDDQNNIKEMIKLCRLEIENIMNISINPLLLLQFDTNEQKSELFIKINIYLYHMYHLNKCIIKVDNLLEVDGHLIDKQKANIILQKFLKYQKYCVDRIHAIKKQKEQPCVMKRGNSHGLDLLRDITLSDMITNITEVNNISDKSNDCQILKNRHGQLYILVFKLYRNKCTCNKNICDSNNIYDNITINNWNQIIYIYDTFIIILNQILS